MFKFLRSSKAPKDKMSLGHLERLHIAIADAIGGSGRVNASALVLNLKELSEVMVYGDSISDKFFEYFASRDMMRLVVDVFAKVPDAAVRVQVLQSVAILLSNIQNKLLIYYILSKGHVNRLLCFTLDAGHEEVHAYFVSLMKSLSLRLDESTLPLLFTDRAGVQAFPLYTRTMMLFGTADRMATTALRAIVLNIMRAAITHDRLTWWLSQPPQLQFVDKCIVALRASILRTSGALRHRQTDTRLDASDVQYMVEDIVDQFLFIQDLLDVQIQAVVQHVQTAFVQVIAEPYIAQPLQALTSPHSKATPGLHPALSLYLGARIQDTLSDSTLAVHVLNVLHAWASEGAEHSGGDAVQATGSIPARTEAPTSSVSDRSNGACTTIRLPETIRHEGKDESKYDAVDVDADADAEADADADAQADAQADASTNAEPEAEAKARSLDSSVISNGSAHSDTKSADLSADSPSPAPSHTPPHSAATDPANPATSPAPAETFEGTISGSKASAQGGIAELNDTMDARAVWTRRMERQAAQLLLHTHTLPHAVGSASLRRAAELLAVRLLTSPPPFECSWPTTPDASSDGDDRKPGPASKSSSLDSFATEPPAPAPRDAATLLQALVDEAASDACSLTHIEVLCCWIRLMVGADEDFTFACLQVPAEERRIDQSRIESSIRRQTTEIRQVLNYPGPIGGIESVLAFVEDAAATFMRNQETHRWSWLRRYSEDPRMVFASTINASHSGGGESRALGTPNYVAGLGMDPARAKSTHPCTMLRRRLHRVLLLLQLRQTINPDSDAAVDLRALMTPAPDVTEGSSFSIEAHEWFVARHVMTASAVSGMAAGMVRLGVVLLRHYLGLAVLEANTPPRMVSVMPLHHIQVNTGTDARVLNVRVISLKPVQLASESKPHVAGPPSHWKFCLTFDGVRAASRVFEHITSSRDSQITRQLGSLSELLCVQADNTPSHMVTEARVVAELV